MALQKENRSNKLDDYINNFQQASDIVLNQSQKNTLVDIMEFAHEFDKRDDGSNYSAPDNITMLDRVKELLAVFSNPNGKRNSNSGVLCNELELDKDLVRPYSSPEQYSNTFNSNTDNTRMKLHLDAVELCRQNSVLTYSDAINIILNDQ